MCILCAIQSWSRKFATMLPWLVIPLIGLWALSQLLPPAFRFEITSPRLACVAVLLVTLLWYEFLMPQLSAWRLRRNARIREMKRLQAIELHKLRKTATRRCRNCLTPYRHQNPGGPKFMCSYCGHISKRPVLDLPVPPGIIPNSGFFKHFLPKPSACQEWFDIDKSSTTCDAFFSREDHHHQPHCFAQKSYYRIFTFACKALASLFFGVLWLWRKIFRVSSSGDDDASADAARRGMLDKQDESGENSQESRGMKARRKAEEKRQARLEKEMLEEEERKQREEVARLVEERRRLRDEKLEAEKERGKMSPRGKEKDSKKEAEKKCQEKKKERDRKSNSERNKKIESDRREKSGTPLESVKSCSTEAGHGFKGVSASNQNRGTAGTRYFDRMRGTFLSSSRAFTGAGFFGKGASTAVSREHKPNTLVDHNLSSTYRKETVQPERFSARANVNGDDKSVNRPVFIESQPSTAPKKSWQQLFTRSNSVSPPSSNVISRPNGKHQSEGQSPPFSSHPTSTQSSDNPINFGLPFSLPQFPIVSTSSTTSLPSSSEAMFSTAGDAPRLFLPEDSEIFEDPCYVPDPVSLLGPVSESLNNFQLDLGFVTDSVSEAPRALNSVIATTDVSTKPSPIESPLSRSRVSEERNTSSLLFPSTPKGQNTTNSVVNDTGSWQMWSSPPLCQDGLGFGGAPGSWLIPQEMNMPNKEDMMRTLPQKTMASLFKKDEIVSESHSSHVLFGNRQNGGAFTNSGPASINGPWLPFGAASSNDNQNLLKPKEEVDMNGLMYGNVSAPNHQFQLSAANSRAKQDWTLQGSRDGTGDPPVTRPQYGGLYSDVQSFWSYD